MKKTLFRVIMLLTLSALVMLSQVASAHHSWNGFHWLRPTSRPAVIRVINNLGPAWQSYFRAAIAKWDRSGLIEIRTTIGQAQNSICPSKDGWARVCNAPYGENGILGQTRVWTNGSHITKAIVLINDTYFSRREFNNAIDRNHVLCHELGHVVGLDHYNTTLESLGTCMDYSQHDRRSQSPDRHDYEEIRIIYSHIDRAAQAIDTPQMIQDITPSGMEPLGTLVQRDEHSAVYEFDLGNGERVITIVDFA